MKAIVASGYGSPDRLSLRDVPEPVPGRNEVLLRVHATALNAADWHLLRADPPLVRLMFGLFKPKYSILGADVAGTVAALGPGVTQWNIGDAVFGDLSGHKWGGLAEYCLARVDLIARKPETVSFAEAAAVPLAGITALQALRVKGAVPKGKRVLINGASGGVGTFAVQLAHAYGAEVTAVTSARNADKVRSFGAAHVIDYATEDFTKSGRRYDLIVGVNGYHPISAYKRALSPGGVYVMVGGTGKQMSEAITRGPFLSLFGDRKLGMVTAQSNSADLEILREFMAARKLKSVIDRTYPLEEAADALRYLEEGHARGKVMIRVVE